MTILEKILARKVKEVEEAKGRISQGELTERLSSVSRPRGFKNALKIGAAPVIIAEIKRRSPSKGEIRKNFDPVECAESYVDGGAAALSVLTDEHYFGGHLGFLSNIRKRAPLPLLRKDFIIDSYQIDETLVSGADAVLLIVAALDQKALFDLYERAKSIDLDVLVEVHDHLELDRAREIGADLIGVNNRNLDTFVTDIRATEKLSEKMPKNAVFVSESGIRDAEDILRLSSVGVQAFLVGETLMRQKNPGLALKNLRRGS